jgi:hypothetical protein
MLRGEQGAHIAKGRMTPNPEMPFQRSTMLHDGVTGNATQCMTLGHGDV